MSINNILVWGGKSQCLIIKNMVDAGLVFFDNKKQKNNKIAFIVDPFLEKPVFETEIPFINDKPSFKKALKEVDSFIVAIAGNLGMARTLISEELCKLKLKPLSVISSHTYIDKEVFLGLGVQIMPNTTINCFCKIGNFSIINSSATIDHECNLGKGVHIMGGASLAGRIKVNDYVTIGTNATIIPDLEIKEGSYVGAGTVVTKNVNKNEIVVGNPSKFLKENSHFYDLNFFK